MTVFMLYDDTIQACVCIDILLLFISHYAIMPPPPLQGHCFVEEKYADRFKHI